MASTGLLTGVNPYRGGNIAVDIVSKPVNLVLQMKQKEDAKKEALNKYFMDYEKTINPAGMRSQDQNAFLKHLGEAKQFYLQNSDKILNPAKYGSDAQTEYMMRLRNAQSIIDQSKQQAADEKADIAHWRQAQTQGMLTPDGYMDALERSHLSLDNPNYQKLDPYKWNFTKPHDEAGFVKNVWGNIKLPTREIEERLSDGRVRYRKEEYLTPEIAQSAVLGALNEYKTHAGTKTNFDNLMKDPAIFEAAQNAFGNQFKYKDPSNPKKMITPKIETPEQFVAGYALLKKPTGEVSTSRADYPWLTKFNKTQGAINARADKDLEAMGDPVDNYINDAKTGKTFSGAEGENIEMVNFPETILKELGRNKRPAVLGRGIGDGKIYNIVYQKDRKGNVTDLIDWTQTQEVPDSQVRAAVVKHALPSGAKVNLINKREKAGGNSEFVNYRKFN